jgi:sulfite reductase (NADPH) flavoprotein alpha-component
VSTVVVAPLPNAYVPFAFCCIRFYSFLLFNEIETTNSLFFHRENNWLTRADMASSNDPFRRTHSLGCIAGPTYTTAQSLVQQVAYSLSDKLFTYSPDTFGLDDLVCEWFAKGEKNANGYATSVHPMQTRQGAGSIALGYMFSKDFNLERRHIPQGVLAASSNLRYLKSTLEQLSLLYKVANPFVAHLAAVDYAGSKNGGMVTDYSSAMTIAEDLGFGMVSSTSAYEAQHMALLATVMAQILPTFHIYDGVMVGRETTRVIDILDQTRLNHAYQSVIEAGTTISSKHMDIQGRAMKLLEAFNGELGSDYGFFEYSGHTSPDAVLVTFGSVESSLAKQIASTLSKQDIRIGAVNVRIYRPFVEEEFLRTLPSSTKVIGVLGQVHNQHAVEEPSIHSSLYQDILPALAFTGIKAQIQEVKYSRSQNWNPISIAAAFQTILGIPVLPENIESVTTPLQLLDSSVQQYSFWDLDTSSLKEVATSLAGALSKESSNNVTMSNTYDSELEGGSVRVDIRKSPSLLEMNYPIDSADTVVVGEVKLLGKVDIMRSVREGGNLILKLPGVKDDDVEKKLPTAFRKSIAQRAIRLFLIDPTATSLAEKGSVEPVIMEVAFLRVALPDSEPTALKKLAAIVVDAELVEAAAKDLDNTLREIEVPKSWAEAELESEQKTLPMNITCNSFVEFDKDESEPPSQLRTWQKAAKGLLFKESYGTKPALRPDLPIKTFTVLVKENRRLTPLTYDRNIFHVEFDLGASGLTYEIGEALGIHAENDRAEVMKFIKFYGLNPEEIVEVASRDDPSVFENRTVYHSLIQNIDIFGRPPKRFYEALAGFADDEGEQRELQILGGPEGSKEFQRRAEVDTITYADVLLEFPSAHPSFHDIVRIVSPMKRREYSIASCQAVTPSSVALMVVVVNWVDPKGRDRFGQATRYLSQLTIGSPITVSIKPSVMKLPPKSTQPLIMAGLGTGLAPFRAFVQHRAMEKAQGKEIGSVLLYMGSRHQREEYCYGEEWEAYQDAGVITLLGRAFSRDQPQKIYIQDRMRQTITDIIQAYIKEEGAFYLCGPTWPVPDVTNVLEEAIAVHARGTGGRKVDPRKEIERLKDVGRYVLEVY